jgi:hypothetical protein
MINVIGCLSKDPRPIFATRRLAAREWKKVDDETMTSFLDANPMTVVDPVTTRTLTPAMTTSALDILKSN